MCIIYFIIRTILYHVYNLWTAIVNRIDSRYFLINRLINFRHEEYLSRRIYAYIYGHIVYVILLLNCNNIVIILYTSSDRCITILQYQLLLPLLQLLQPTSTSTILARRTLKNSFPFACVYMIIRRTL